MDIKKGQWFKCTNDLVIGPFVLFIKGKLYQSDHDGSIDGVNHGIYFDEYFEPVVEENSEVKTICEGEYIVPEGYRAISYDDGRKIKVEKGE